MIDREWRRFLKLLQNVLDDIKKSLESINKNSEAENHSRYAQPANPQVVIVDRLNLPLETARYYESQQRQEPPKIWRIVKPWVEFGSFAALVAYVSVTACTLSAIKQQAEVMQGQLDANDRPWLGLNQGIRVESVNISRGNIASHVTIPFRNYGKSPALHIGTSVLLRTASFYEASGDSPTFRNHSDIACLSANNPSGPVQDATRGFGLVLFPIDSTSSIDNTATSGGTFDPADALQVVGCIAYDFPLGKHHHTRFCFISEKSAAEFRAGDALFTCMFGNTAD